MCVGGGAPCFRIGGAEDNFIFYIEYCFGRRQSVSAHVWTQEKNCAGRVDRTEIEGYIRGPRGPKNYKNFHPLIFYRCTRLSNKVKAPPFFPGLAKDAGETGLLWGFKEGGDQISLHWLKLSFYSFGFVSFRTNYATQFFMVSLYKMHNQEKIWEKWQFTATDLSKGDYKTHNR